MCHVLEGVAMGESTRLPLTAFDMEVEAWINNGGLQPPRSRVTSAQRRLRPGD
jgi:hypothetical protein